MTMQLLYIKNGASSDITAYTGNYSRSDNKDSLGMEFNFQLTSNPYDEYTRDAKLEVGNKVVFSNNGTTVFSGIIAKASRSDVATISYTCYDYGFYLNKSEAMIQFNGVSVSNAISRLCSENDIPVDSICSISTNVNKIYKGDKISDIIKDLLKLAFNETGTKYRLEMRNNKLFIDAYEDLIITAEYKAARNIGEFNATKMIGSFSSEYSIENMADNVMVVSSGEKHMQVYANMEDSNNISKFGRIVKIEKVDDKTKAQALQIAKNKMKELNKVARTFSVTLFGDDSVRAGRMLVFNQKEIDLEGTFLIKNCTHTYNGKTHLMKLDLEV